MPPDASLLAKDLAAQRSEWRRQFNVGNWKRVLLGDQTPGGRNPQNAKGLDAKNSVGREWDQAAWQIAKDTGDRGQSCLAALLHRHCERV